MLCPLDWHRWKSAGGIASSSEELLQRRGSNSRPKKFAYVKSLITKKKSTQGVPGEESDHYRTSQGLAKFRYFGGIPERVLCGKSEGIREAFGGHSEAFGGVRGAFGFFEPFLALRFVGSQETDPGWTYPLYNI